MNKYELKVTVTEIDSLIGRRRFKEAAEVADSVDWRKVRNVRTLCRVSDVYKINKRYDDSKKILELAYVKNPYARQIIFSLCELELKLGNYVRALQLYNEYINVAPRDADRFVLQYKLYKAQNVSVNERIAVLEELARHDMRDRWAFELARLYLEAGERTLGSFFETGSATAVECLGLGGLDYVIIDNEHGPYNPQSTLEFVRAAKLYGMTPFARVSEISREAVLRQLDVGVMGLVIPDVRRVDEVERIVEYGK